jgi:hypothetical protein
MKNPCTSSRSRILAQEKSDIYYKMMFKNKSLRSSSQATTEGVWAGRRTERCEDVRNFFHLHIWRINERRTNQVGGVGGKRKHTKKLFCNFKGRRHVTDLHYKKGLLKYICR